MDLRQLTTFRTVAELGSLSKASDRLRTAQPALSRQIKLLEHDLRTILFVRHGRGMVPTETGRVLFERTAGLMQSLEQAREAILTVSGTPAGRVVVGFVPTISGALAAKVARRVVDQYPSIELRIVDAYGGFLIDWLHRGDIDLAVIYGPANNLHLDVENLRHEQLCMVGNVGSGLTEMAEVSLEWAAHQPLVLPSAPHGMRNLINAAAAAAKLDLNVRIEADSFTALVDIVAERVGFSFLPLYAIARYLKLGLLEFARITPPLKRELVLARQSHQGGSLAVGVVADIIRAEANLLRDQAEHRPSAILLAGRSA